jgi:hypothetical protein
MLTEVIRETNQAFGAVNRRCRPDRGLSPVGLLARDGGREDICGLVGNNKGYGEQGLDPSTNLARLTLANTLPIRISRSPFHERGTFNNSAYRTDMGSLRRYIKVRVM